MQKSFTCTFIKWVKLTKWLMRGWCIARKQLKKRMSLEFGGKCLLKETLSFMALDSQNRINIDLGGFFLKPSFSKYVFFGHPYLKCKWTQYQFVPTYVNITTSTASTFAIANCGCLGVCLLNILAPAIPECSFVLHFVVWLKSYLSYFR